MITPFEQRLAPLDLYVGHLGEEAELIELCPQGAAVRLALGDAALVRSCLERAFHGADPAEFAAKGRIARDYFSHRDSWPEHSRIFLVRGEPVGVCLISQRFYYSQERAYPYVDVIAVDPSLRRQGLGQTLLRMSMRSLWAEGHRSIIHAHIRRGNVGSESLFRGCDFLFWRRDDD